MCLYSGKVDEKPKQLIYRRRLLLSTESISNDIALHEREITSVESERKRLFIEPAELAGVCRAVYGFKCQSLTVFDETLEFRY
jgi:hypothetical protein